jgi:hypothetical protein
MSSSQVNPNVQKAQDLSFVALLTAIGSAAAVFAIQLGVFELLRQKLPRI